jgi:OmpA-OmpF porin, OOP family
MLRKPALALTAALGALFGAAPAAAQTCGTGQACQTASGPLDRFQPAPAGDSFFATPSADVPGRLKPSVAVTWTYAKDPLVLRTVSGKTPELAWVSHQMLLHTLVGLELFSRVKLEIDLPATLTQGGSSGSVLGTSVVAPSGANLDDVRGGARVVLFRQTGLIPSAGLSFSAWFPSGKPASFGGGPGVRFAPALLVGGEYARWAWSAHFGRRFQSERVDQVMGSQIFGGAAAALRWRGLQVGPEFYISSGAGDRVAGIVRDVASAEILLGARYALGPVTLGAGGGPGLGNGPGTPTYRLFASLGFAMELQPKKARGEDDGAGRDRAGSGRARPPPAAIAPPAPLPDTDGDGIADADDACPAVIGVKSDEKARNGCPPDRDRDGIYDVDDACPDEPGVYDADPKKSGCPRDTDGDGIIDSKDACPNEKGKATDDPKTNGCPAAVRVEGQQIIILEQVQFDTAKATIKKESDPLLSQVASVMRDHPEIARVAVDGHTDSRGFERDNVNLSERRAIAVVGWLVEHGIDARRLEARGFGPRRPIADNKTDAGRQKNRRVEFLIRARTELGERGWFDGPVP